MPEKFEKQFAKPETQEKPLERLKREIREMALGLQKECVPVDNRARINIDQFSKVYSQHSIESDRLWIKDLKERWKRAAISESRWSWAFPKERALKEVTIGDTWEMLTTSILHKNLGKDFIVVRTSEYDDARYKVDNIILDRKTGNIICAFDEIGAADGELFEKKKNNVLQRNWQRGGADLKYGIFMEKDGNEMKLKKGPIYQIPLFYLARNEEQIKDVLKDPSKEKEVFSELMGSIKKQIGEIKEGPVHSKLGERLDFFEKIVEKF